MKQQNDAPHGESARIPCGYPVMDQRHCIQVDKYFGRLMDFLKELTRDAMKDAIVQNLQNLRRTDGRNYTGIVSYYNKYSDLWGRYDPDKGIFDLVDNRVEALYDHRRDFEWLYGRLCDYRSKKILLNILSFWLTTEYAKIGEIADQTFGQYFDFDLIQCDKNEVFVDIGAFIGDTLVNYVNAFGADCYSRIFCYEIVPANVQCIHRNVALFHLKNVDVRAKGASDTSGRMYLAADGVSPVNQLAPSGAIGVPTVTIDADIDGPVTFIKMDIEGAEEQALLGCREKIKRYHPKLALSAYHNHKDLWKLARIIDETDASYRFYLRYYGSSRLPTEYVLYGL